MCEKQKYRLVLASASPRRLSLLRELGLMPSVHPAQVDERELGGEAPGRYVLRLAEAKCLSVARLMPVSERPCLVIAADTAVIIDGRILGKPSDAADAMEMLRLLSGKSHEVLTGVYITRTDNGGSAGGVVRTAVKFRDYDELVIREYIASGEPLDKAGAYAIQGGGGRLAESVTGSWSNVVGLPLESIPHWLDELGLEIDQLV
jgi:septum formation protein